MSQLPDNSAVYLVHSYQFVAEKEEDVIAYYDYQDLKVCAAIQHENIIGFKFTTIVHLSGTGIQFQRNLLPKNCLNKLLI